MYFLCAAIAASALFSLGLKVAEDRDYNRIVVALCNYLTGGFLAMLWWLSPWCAGQGMLSTETLLWGMVGGLTWVGGLLTMMISTRETGVALTAGFSRLSLLLTIVFCILLWSEQLTWIEGIGVGLAVIAILLMGIPAAKRNGKTTTWGITLLLLVLCANGAAQIVLKVFEQLCPATELSSFMMVMFFTGAALTGFITLTSGKRPKANEMLFGTILGLPNLFSGSLLILALETMRGTIVFPVVNAGTLCLVAIAGLVFWKEKTGRCGLAGLLLTVIALIFIKGSDLIMELLELSQP